MVRLLKLVDPIWQSNTLLIELTIMKGEYGRRAMNKTEKQKMYFCPLLSSFGMCIERRKVIKQDRNMSFYPLLSKEEMLLSRTKIYIFSLSVLFTFSIH